MTKIQYCKNCKHLGHDGMFGLICDVNGDNKNHDCQKYEEDGDDGMTEKRFTKDDTLMFSAIKDNGKPMKVKEVVDLLNTLYEENHKQKTTIRMLEQQNQRQISRNKRLHKDWDRLYQHLIDMGLMTDEEILKVVWND